MILNLLTFSLKKKKKKKEDIQKLRIYICKRSHVIYSQPPEQQQPLAEQFENIFCISCLVSSNSSHHGNALEFIKTYPGTQNSARSPCLREKRIGCR